MTPNVDSLDGYLIEPEGKSPDGGYGMEADALAMDSANTPQNPRRGRMSDLKQQIERHEYKVDSSRVAEEMIRRLRLAQWARRALLSDADGGPSRPAAAH